MINSAKEFISLLESKDLNQQKRTRYENASEKVWFEIIESFPDHINDVVLNKTLPITVLRYLSKHSDPKIRWQVAIKRQLDIGLFEELAGDPDDSVRERIAYNRKAPKQVIEKLSHDSIERVAVIAKERLRALENSEKK